MIQNQSKLKIEIKETCGADLVCNFLNNGGFEKCGESFL